LGRLLRSGKPQRLNPRRRHERALLRATCRSRTAEGSNEFAQAIVAQKVKDNRFAIRTNEANVEVSWQVTGIRQDAWANKNRIPVEELKNEIEKGYYLHPDAFDKPEEKSTEWARDLEMMQKLKRLREQPKTSR